MTDTLTVTHSSGKLFVDRSTVQVGDAFCSGEVIGYEGDNGNYDIGDYVAFDPDDLTALAH